MATIQLRINLQDLKNQSLNLNHSFFSFRKVFRMKIKKQKFITLNRNAILLNFLKCVSTCTTMDYFRIP